MNKQKANGIEWTDYTINPVGGCHHGCAWEMPDGNIAHCYAKKLAERFTRAYPEGFEHIYWRPHLLKEPLKVKEPSRIFFDSMSDLMDIKVEDWQIQKVLDMCEEASWHTFQLLTKYAPRLLNFDIPPNVWVGVSSPPDWMYDPVNYEKRLTARAKRHFMHRAFRVLEKVDVPVKWISYEPLSDDFSDILADHPNVIQWAVIGAASNGRTIYPPDPEHFRLLMSELRRQKIPVFFKGNMRHLPEAQADWFDQFPQERSVYLG